MKFGSYTAGLIGTGHLHVAKRTKAIIYSEVLHFESDAMSGDFADVDILGLTAQIVSAHVGNNSVPGEQLPGLIQDVFRSLSAIGTITPIVERPEPAVPIKKSVFADYIICLEDGKKLKMLKRHLQASFGMSPADYRARWGLAADYPMVAPNYAAVRSTLAKQIGLGNTRRDAVPEQGAAPATKRKPGRPRAIRD